MKAYFYPERSVPFFFCVATFSYTGKPTVQQSLIAIDDSKVNADLHQHNLSRPAGYKLSLIRLPESCKAGATSLFFSNEPRVKNATLSGPADGGVVFPAEKPVLPTPIPQYLIKMIPFTCSPCKTAEEI